MSKSLIICNVCGEENSSVAKFCSSCGAKLKKAKNSGSNLKSNDENKNVKQINPTAIIYSAIILIAVGFILLYAAGIFDSPVVSSIPGQNNAQQFTGQNNPHSGVSLNDLQKIRDIETRVNNNPNDYASLLNLGHLLNDSGFFEKAINRYEQYLEKFPNKPDVLIDMGVCYFELKQYDEALKYMKKGISMNPRHQIGLFNIGIVNSAMGNTNEAKIWWGKSVEINPNANIAKKAKELINQN